MGEKGLLALEKLPSGYKTVPPGSKVPGTFGDHPSASGDGPVRTSAGQAFPDDGRPGHPITWDEEHAAWRPPGFTPDAADNERIFNPTTGQNGVWDGDKKQWVDTATGKALGYEQ